MEHAQNVDFRHFCQCLKLYSVWSLKSAEQTLPLHTLRDTQSWTEYRYRHVQKLAPTYDSLIVLCALDRLPNSFWSVAHS
jgi:hypothetical protein